MKKHTPGPWNIKNQSSSNYDFEIEAPSKKGLLKVICRLGSWFGEEKEANARLIAVAPDLLKACKRIVERPDVVPLESDINFAKLAIAKATGE